ncbi:MAG: cytochrome bc complex cytochrome b subunit [Elusimicrobia bacterium]|nr:cytochrome bc complex cytochrome b subunit [Elusimicrobiota bacterium]
MANDQPTQTPPKPENPLKGLLAKLTGNGVNIPTNPEDIKKAVINSQIWRSVFRGGVWKNTPRDRAAHIIGNVWLHLHPVRIRPRALKFIYSWGMGGISFWLFLLLTLSGILLMFYYRPSPELAYRDMKDLEFAVSYGWFWRNMHRWCAHAMVITVIVHMVRVFLTGAYKTPREFNWVLGVVLLTLTLFLSFTGYLLPWDQLALWAVTVGTNMAAATPLLGNEGPFSSLLGMKINNDIRFGLLGGTAVGEATLIRFYVLHCIFVPFVVGAMIMLHFWRIRKDSFSAAPLAPNEEKVEVWPNLVAREYVAAALTTVAILLWTLLMNAPLEEAANPTVTPNPSKAPWYFLGLQELLVYFDPWIAGVLLPNMIIVGLCAIPYLDTNPKGVGYYTWKERPFANSMFMLGLIMWFVLIFIGQYCRGPSWAWYWPWEDWSVHKPLPPKTWDVPNMIGGPLMLFYFGLGMGLPRLIKKDIDWKIAVPTAGLLSLVTGISMKIAHALLLGAAGNVVVLDDPAQYSLLDRLLLFVQTNIPHFGIGSFLLISIFLFLFIIFGFLLPQRYIRNLAIPNYATTMVFVLLTLGVLLKMGGRLGFNIKYVFSIPHLNFNI